MSIDEPIESTQSNVNSNNSRTPESINITEPEATNVQLPASVVAASTSLSLQSDEENKPESRISQPALSDSNNNDNISNSAAASSQTLSSDASSAAKASNNGANIGISETFNEKKRKLTLPIGSINSSPNSELSSISSSDSTKHLAVGQVSDQKVINNTTNGDLVKHLDNHNNISTPYLDKILFDLNANNSHLGMKTPGSATIAFLTPNGTFPSNNILQSQFSYSGLNFFNTAEFKTPSEENNTIGITLAQNSGYNNPGLSNANVTNVNQYRRQNSEINSIYMNPNEIFINQNQNQDSSNKTPTNNINIPKYTTLTNVPDLNGNSQNPLIMTTDNAAKLATNVTGNYTLLEQHNPSTNMNKLNEGCNEPQQDTFSNNMLNNSTNKILNTIKDEFHTVPEHPPILKSQKSASNKRKSVSGNAGANSKNMKTNKAMVSSLSSGSTDSSVDSLTNNNSAAIMDRRDTGNSSIDSNLDTYSPINLDQQARIKIEIKRERNREAARKCRTRKLEKIANLEIQVKSLSEANEVERAKNENLVDEINKIRQKLELHKKIHNCDLKMI